MIEKERTNLNVLKNQINEKLKYAAQVTKENEDNAKIMREIWELSKKKFVLEAELNRIAQYKGIIFTIGFSPQPIILNILANKPQAVFFIYTKETEKALDEIVKETRLKPSMFKGERISRDSAADSYDLVKKGLKFLTEEKKIEKKLVALDPSGGTKIMSVGCGIAASVFNIDILYVNNRRYNPELRCPEPGSEVLITVRNPFEIYQDDKLIEGLNFLQNLNFINAKNVFITIKLQSSEPLFPELLSDIADILHYWDLIDYNTALKIIKKTKILLNKMNKKLGSVQNKIDNQLNSWEEYLKRIYDQIKSGVKEVEKISPLLIFDIKKNADREFYNFNYNNAALKYYRTIEMINQYILFNNYNFDNQNPNYNELIIEKDNLKQIKDENIEQTILIQYNIIWQFINQKISQETEYIKKEVLPRKFGLITGFIMRLILGDQSIKKEFIFSVFQAIEKRNQSIFAHGIASINKKDCERLKKITENVIAAVDIDENLRSYIFQNKSIEKLVSDFKKAL